MAKHFVIDWNTWIGKTFIGLADGVANTMLLCIPLYFSDWQHLMSRESWMALGGGIALISLKTVAFALSDFKKYVQEVDN